MKGAELVQIKGIETKKTHTEISLEYITCNKPTSVQAFTTT